MIDSFSHYSNKLLNQMLNDKVDVSIRSNKIRRIQNIIEEKEELQSSNILFVQNGMNLIIIAATFNGHRVALL